MIGFDSFTLKPTGKGPDCWHIKGLQYPTRYSADEGRNSPRTGTLDLSSDPYLAGSPVGWTYVEAKRTRSGTYHVFCHSSGITLGAWEDGRVLFASGNVSRLQTGQAHNGQIVSEPSALHDSVECVKQTLEPVLQSPPGENFAITGLEIGGVVRQPFSVFSNLLSGLNYPGLKKDMYFNPGKSMKWGTSKSSTFTLRIYDKGEQLNKFPEVDNLPENVYTRVEIALRDQKLWDAFGGQHLDDLTELRMREEFFTRVHHILPTPVADLRECPKTKTGMLAMSLYQCLLGNNSCKPVQEWWLEQNKMSPHSKTVLKEAMSILQGLAKISMPDLVPRNAPVIHLPGTAL